MSLSPKVHNALLVIGALFLIASNDVIVKLSAEQISVGQILLCRGLMLIGLFLLVLKLKGMPLLPPTMFDKYNLLRGGCETMATTSFVFSLSLMPISLVSMLTWSSPIFITIAGALLLKEQVGRYRWFAVIGGFIGVLLISNPTDNQYSWLIVLPIFTAVSVALRDVATRKTRADLHPIHITLITVIMVTLVGAILSMSNWQPLHLQHIAALAVAALLIGTGFVMQITAVKRGEISFLAPFSYFGILYALCYGALIWQESISSTTILGMLFIVGSGLVIALRQQHQQRKRHANNTGKAKV